MNLVSSFINRVFPPQQERTLSPESQAIYDQAMQRLEEMVELTLCVISNDISKRLKLSGPEHSVVCRVVRDRLRPALMKEIPETLLLEQVQNFCEGLVPEEIDAYLEELVSEQGTHPGAQQFNREITREATRLNYLYESNMEYYYTKDLGDAVKAALNPNHDTAMRC